MSAPKWECRYLGSRDVEHSAEPRSPLSRDNDIHEAIALVHLASKSKTSKNPAVTLVVEADCITADPPHVMPHMPQPLATVTEVHDVGKV